MSSADACVTAYTRGLELSKLSLVMPVTFTGDRMVFITSRDQRRGDFCLGRPARAHRAKDQRDRAQNDGGGPDQRGKNEIRAQAAEPAMAVDGVNCEPPLRPRRDSRPRLTSRAQLGSLLFPLRRWL